DRQAGAAAGPRPQGNRGQGRARADAPRDLEHRDPRPDRRRAPRSARGPRAARGARPHPGRRVIRRCMKVYVYGAGKLGSSLARALRRTRPSVALRAARRGLPRSIDADLVVLAVRDRDLAPLAAEMAKRRLVPKKSVVVHVAGALSAEP